ncbi:MAG: hypothetical protein PHD29_07600 [bacterium]|nr:hypothetical protein [bacterium]MDD5756842.1 hypothetical protein [bacterium]
MIAAKYAIALATAFLWTTGFSLMNQLPVRGLRNLGILSCYVIGIIMFMKVGFKRGIATWIMFGLIGGFLYFTYDLVSRAKATSEIEKPPISLSHFIYGQFAWPIMGPEAIEYILAEIGMLKSPPAVKNIRGDKENSQPEAARDAEKMRP